MATTITHSGGTITPTIMDGYRASRRPGTIVHEVPNRSNPDISLRATGLRYGQFLLVFSSQSAAVAAFAALSAKEVFTLADTDLPTVGMSFVVHGGEIVLDLDPETRKVMTVTVPYQEVTP